MNRAQRPLTISLLLLAVGHTVAAATYVLPVVVRGTQGAAGSYWDSEVRIVRLDMQHPLTVRRAWVALKGGGFTDDPNTAPVWTLPPPNPEWYAYRMILLTGSDLLAGVSDSHGAVALEIDGPAKVMLHNANTEGQPRLPSGEDVWACCLPGTGHMAAAATQSLSGPSYIAWATASEPQSPLRTNVGLINCGTTPLHLHLRVFLLFPFQMLVPPIPTAYWDQSPDALVPELDIDLPPLGWTQLNDVLASLQSCTNVNGCSPLLHLQPSLIQIDPTGNGSYLAYATPVYTPKNDPEFIWAEPGDVSPPASLP